MSEIVFITIVNTLIDIIRAHRRFSSRCVVEYEIDRSKTGGQLIDRLKSCAR